MTQTPLRARLQNVRQQLAGVRASAAVLQQQYGQCAQISRQTDADLSSTLPLMQKALVDTGLTIVAQEGAGMLAAVGQGLTRLRQNESQLPLLVQQANHIHFRVPGLAEELGKLASEISGPVGSQLAHCQQLVQISSSQHQGAARAAGWAQSKATMADSELSQCGNDLRAVAADRLEVSVAADAARARPRLDQARNYSNQQSQFLRDTQEHQQNALLCLEEVDWRLAGALDQLGQRV